MDMALAFVARHNGEKVAEDVAAFLEYTGDFRSVCLLAWECHWHTLDYLNILLSFECLTDYLLQGFVEPPQLHIERFSEGLPTT